MEPTEALAARFTEHRPHLLAVAQRLLGPTGEADDAVQEAWLRLQRVSAAGDPGIDDLAAWLTTVVARISLNLLRARRTHPEDPLVDGATEHADGDAPPADDPGPEEQALTADAMGPALLVVLDALAPAERLAFVLHDVFGLPFDEIAPIVERSVPATRQLASRARRRVRGGGTTTEADVARRREVVEAFLAASRNGDFGALLSVLDPDVVLRADPVAVSMAAANAGAPELAPEVAGADAVARVFAGRARAARPALLDGDPGLAFALRGRTVSLFRITVEDGRITAVDLVADPEAIAATDVVLT
jgi:RNA polymerase sigma factor (sigma-70 family)